MPGKRVGQPQPADVLSDAADLPPDHQALVTALYHAIRAYQPATEDRSEVIVFESTAEPARSSSHVAKRRTRFATNVAVLPVKGSRMSVVAEPNGRPLAWFLCQKLRDVSARQPDTGRQNAGSFNEPPAAMTAGKAVYRDGASSSAG